MSNRIQRRIHLAQAAYRRLLSVSTPFSGASTRAGLALHPSEDDVREVLSRWTFARPARPPRSRSPADATVSPACRSAAPTSVVLVPPRVPFSFRSPTLTASVAALSRSISIARPPDRLRQAPCTERGGRRKRWRTSPPSTIPGLRGAASCRGPRRCDYRPQRLIRRAGRANADICVVGKAP